MVSCMQRAEKAEPKEEGPRSAKWIQRSFQIGCGLCQNVKNEQEFDLCTKKRKDSRKGHNG